jgi:hypothetical protein
MTALNTSANLNSRRAIWDQIAMFFRLLWVCRISTVSAVFGVLLFLLVVQAQNLLADTSYGDLSIAAFLHWGKFFLGLFVIWAFTVHYAARRAVDDDYWIVDAQTRLQINPGAFEAICDDIRDRHRFLITWVPRLLGLIPFAAVAIGLYKAHETVRGAGLLPEGIDAQNLAVILGYIDAVAAIAFLVFVIFRKQLVARSVRRINHRRAASGGDPGTRYMQTLVRGSLVVTVLVFAVAYFAPIFIGVGWPRAALVPVLFGILVLPLAWIARCSHKDGVPYLFFLALVCALATGLNTQFNDMRSLPSDGAPTDGRQIELDDAIKRWQAANECSGQPERCPSPLIVAADGGASRAAFMTATVLGAILDRTEELQPKLAGPARRIFAISGVSGGAVGAAFMRAALADAAETGGAPPCKIARVHRTWYGAPSSNPNSRLSWKDCLQALAAGDFLSPVFVGLAFRDNFAPPTHLLSERLRIRDRAVLLEQALERHYNYVTGLSGSDFFETGDFCADTSPKKGLCRRFGYWNNPELGADPAKWVPLLLLNGTSVQTGRRIVTSDLISTTKGHPRQALYSPAYDLFEMRSTACPAPSPHPAGEPPTGTQSERSATEMQHCGTELLPLDAPDILLSTAALTSARFPLISPAGAIQNLNADGHGDEIVDGGYFENSGVTTALDLWRALDARNLKPLILALSNEPEGTHDKDEVPRRPDVTPALGPSMVAGLIRGLPARIMGAASMPLETLLYTRSGHAAEARDLAVRILESSVKSLSAQGSGTGRWYNFTMFASMKPAASASGSTREKSMCAKLLDSVSKRQDKRKDDDGSIRMTKVSMSWWLSYAVQADIDAQLCAGENQTTLANLMKELQLSP